MEERVPALSFKSFGAFLEGAAHRAESVGDTGPSSPGNWIAGFGEGQDHVLVTLHAISPEAMEGYSDRVRAWFAEGDAFREIWCQDGMALMEMQNGQPVPTPKFTSDIPTESLTPPFAAARKSTGPITSSPASHGSSCCGKKRRTTTYPSRGNSA